MRIAVLADVHGNLPALEAVLDDLARRGGAEIVIDLGDRVSGPLWPAETLQLLEEVSTIAIRGNHDRIVGREDPEQMGPSDRVAYDALTAAARARLAVLPAIATPLAGLLACHGTPLDDARYLLDSVEAGRLVRDDADRIAGRLGGHGDIRLVLCAHSHRPDLVRLPDGRFILNPGSVGCPAYDDPSPPQHISESGSPHARYAIVDWRAGVPGIDFCAIPYDFEMAARRAESFGRPEWAAALRLGLRPNPLPGA